MRIRFTETALSEIDEILSYISERNPGAAIEMAEAIRHTIAWINTRPKTSPVVFRPTFAPSWSGDFSTASITKSGATI